MKNLFVALEGIDGSGKSTQARLLADKLTREGHKLHATFEPTDGPVGTMIRAILKGHTATDERVIAGLFVADRLDHLLNKEYGIIKKMEEGYTVVCDRYCFSSYAYQGSHMSMNWVIDANAMSASILRPDLNIFIDVPVDMCMQRITAHRLQVDLYETLEQLTTVKNNFFKAFEKLRDQERIVIIDGNRQTAEVAADVYQACCLD